MVAALLVDEYERDGIVVIRIHSVDEPRAYSIAQRLFVSHARAGRRKIVIDVDESDAALSDPEQFARELLGLAKEMQRNGIAIAVPRLWVHRRQAPTLAQISAGTV